MFLSVTAATAAVVIIWNTLNTCNRFKLDYILKQVRSTFQIYKIEKWLIPPIYLKKVLFIFLLDRYFCFIGTISFPTFLFPFSSSIM